MATKNKQQQQEPTHEQIAQRAYELSQNDGAAGEEDNWHRAERELRGEPELDGPWAKIGSGDTDNLTGD